MFKINLRSKVRCTITNYEGVVVARDEWTNGCRRYGVQAPMDKEGKVPDLRWIDEQDLEVLPVAGFPAEVVVEEKAAKDKTDGGQRTRVGRGGPQPTGPTPMSK